MGDHPVSDAVLARIQSQLKPGEWVLRISPDVLARDYPEVDGQVKSAHKKSMGNFAGAHRVLSGDDAVLEAVHTGLEQVASLMPIHPPIPGIGKQAMKVAFGLAGEQGPYQVDGELDAGGRQSLSVTNEMRKFWRTQLPKGNAKRECEEWQDLLFAEMAKDDHPEGPCKLAATFGPNPSEELRAMEENALTVGSTDPLHTDGGACAGTEYKESDERAQRGRGTRDTPHDLTHLRAMWTLVPGAAPSGQCTMLYMRRLQLMIVKQSPLLTGGIAMGGDARGWSAGVELRVLHGGAPPRPARYQHKIDWIVFSPITFNKVVAKAWIRVLAKRFGGSPTQPQQELLAVLEEIASDGEMRWFKLV